MTYDQSLTRINEILSQLESDEAVSLDDYKRLAKEAQQLLRFCRDELTSIEDEMNKVFEN